MDISTLYSRYKAGTIDPDWYWKLFHIKQEFDKQQNTVKAISERANREKWGAFQFGQELNKLFEPLLDKYLPEVEKIVGNRNIADAFVGRWLENAAGISQQSVPIFFKKYEERLGRWLWNYYDSLGKEQTNQLWEIANLSLPPVSGLSSNQQSQQIAQLQQQIAQMQEELQRTRSAPSSQPTPQPSQPQQVGNNWELPEEGLLQTGEFATQLAKQRQQQDANLMASGLTRQQILQQRGSENIVRELGLSKMIAEQRRKSIQDWLQTVAGLQQQVRPPDFTGLREIASAFQEGTSAQQQMMMKLFENLMRQGGS